MNKRGPWWLFLLVPVLVICMLFGAAGGGTLCAGGVKLASMIDGLEAMVDPDGMISLSKGTRLDSEVLNILHPKGERDGRDIYELDASCGASSTLVDRAAAQEGWLSEEEVRRAAPSLGIALVLGTLIIVAFGSVTRRKTNFAT